MTSPTPRRDDDLSPARALAALRADLAGMDLHLLDQLLKGRLAPGATVLDAGCGHGRNSGWLLRHGFSVFGIDRDPEAVEAVRAVSRDAGRSDAETRGRFVVGALEERLPSSPAFDFVIANAVFHFAEDAAHWRRMAGALAASLSPGGVLFARFATTHGLEDRLKPLPGRPGWFLLPDGSERFLTSLDKVRETTRGFGLTPLEPLKTVDVEGLRSMTTWVVQRAEPLPRL